VTSIVYGQSRSELGTAPSHCIRRTVPEEMLYLALFVAPGDHRYHCLYWTTRQLLDMSRVGEREAVIQV
jgi:hypothetical protein